ncbi:MAG: hypothetical protein QOD02_3346 [Mycobacterium sp.]|jgi:hypothetical protein|nr:hypothetical protein [Mycobacterium sp.]MDT5170015.1 hypothetical protein [Mycobacterium sp.]
MAGATTDDFGALARVDLVPVRRTYSAGDAHVWGAAAPCTQAATRPRGPNPPRLVRWPHRGGQSALGAYAIEYVFPVDGHC